MHFGERKGGSGPARRVHLGTHGRPLSPRSFVQWRRALRRPVHNILPLLLLPALKRHAACGCGKLGQATMQWLLWQVRRKGAHLPFP